MNIQIREKDVRKYKIKNKSHKSNIHKYHKKSPKINVTDTDKGINIRHKDKMSDMGTIRSLFFS